MCYICRIPQTSSLGRPPVFRDHLLAQLNHLSSDFVYCGARHLDAVPLPPVHLNCGQLSHGPRSRRGSQTPLFLCFLPWLCLSYGHNTCYMVRRRVISPCLCSPSRGSVISVARPGLLCLSVAVLLRAGSFLVLGYSIP